MIAFPRSGVYAITDGALTARYGGLSAAVESALRGGAVAVQYRDKSADHDRRLREGKALATLCRAYHTPLIINDDVELACELAADGVHLGKDDPGALAARQRLGPDAIVGVSCYNRPERALEAQDAGASYVAFGSFYPSPNKPAAVRATVECLASARALVAVPIVAIGGITANNAGELVAGGADVVAVISHIFASADPQTATLALVQALTRR